MLPSFLGMYDIAHVLRHTHNHGKDSETFGRPRMRDERSREHTHYIPVSQIRETLAKWAHTRTGLCGLPTASAAPTIAILVEIYGNVARDVHKPALLPALAAPRPPFTQKWKSVLFLCRTAQGIYANHGHCPCRRSSVMGANRPRSVRCSSTRRAPHVLKPITCGGEHNRGRNALVRPLRRKMSSTGVSNPDESLSGAQLFFANSLPTQRKSWVYKRGDGSGTSRASSGTPISSTIGLKNFSTSTSETCAIVAGSHFGFRSFVITADRTPA